MCLRFGLKDNKIDKTVKQNCFSSDGHHWEVLKQKTEISTWLGHYVEEI